MVVTKHHLRAVKASQRLLLASQSALYSLPHHHTSRQASPQPINRKMFMISLLKIETSSVYMYLHHCHCGVDFWRKRQMNLIFITITNPEFLQHNIIKKITIVAILHAS